MRSTIFGTGIHVPGEAIDNHRMARIMDTSHEWIVQRTGIEQRYLAGEGVTTSDIAIPAARAALENAGVPAADIDYIVFATMTPDVYFPGSGPFLQRGLGIERTPCLDIRQQCAGFIYGLQVADALIRSGQYRNVLLVGAEVHAGFMTWSAWDVLCGRSDRKVSEEEIARNTRFRDRTVLFGDAAGALVVRGEESSTRGVVDILLYTDGKHAERLITRCGGSAYRPYFRPEMAESGEIVPVVEGREVYKLAVKLMPEVIREILERNDLTLDDVDLVVMHQANLRINEACQQRLGLPDEKVFNNIRRYGNTTAATIPLAFHEAKEQGRVKPGDLVCFVALGSGLNWGAVLYRA